MILTVRELVSWLHFMHITLFAKSDARSGGPSLDTQWRTFVHGATMVVLDGLGCGSGVNVTLALQWRTKAAAFLLQQFDTFERPRDADLPASLRNELKNILEDVIDTTTIFDHVRNLVSPVTRDPGAMSIERDDLDDNLSVHFGVSPFHIACGPVARGGGEAYAFNAPTTFSNLRRVLRALQLRRAVMLEGSPGVGKTSLIVAIAKAAGYGVTRINLSEQTDIADLLGSDMPAPSSKESDDNMNQFVWCDGPLMRALRQGQWVILDELNLASQSVLEGLNSLLDHRADVYIPELDKTFHCPSSFRIFACQNPLTEGGARKGLPKSFLNRFTRVYVQPLLDSDMIQIVQSLYPQLRDSTVPSPITNSSANQSANALELMVKFNSAIRRATMVDHSFGLNGGPWDFNLRDLLRWCHLLSAGYTSRNSPQYGDTPSYFRRVLQPQRLVPVLYASRFRTAEDRAAVLRLSEATFGSAVTEFLFFPSLSVTATEVFLDGGAAGSAVTLPRNRASLPIQNEQVVLDGLMTPLHRVMIAVKQRWPVLLVGGPSTGKSHLLETISQLSGNGLVEIQMSSSVDASELLGCFEQRDNTCILNGFAQEQVSSAANSIARVALVAARGSNKSAIIELLTQLMRSRARLKAALERDDMTPQNLCREIQNVLEDCSKVVQMLISDSSHVKHASRETTQALLVDVQELNVQFQRLRAGTASSVSDGDSVFEWIDGPLVKAVEEGKWLVLENVNHCTSAVLDRLNALLEPNGELLVNECGPTANNELRIIKPHPNFRIFMTMDPQYGEISRAFRNRCIEIFMAKSDHEGDTSDLLRVACDAGLAPYQPFARAMVAAHQDWMQQCAAKPGNAVPTPLMLKKWALLTRAQLNRGVSFASACCSSFEISYRQQRQSGRQREEDVGEWLTAFRSRIDMIGQHAMLPIEKKNTSGPDGQCLPLDMQQFVALGHWPMTSYNISSAASACTQYDRTLHCAAHGSCSSTVGRLLLWSLFRQQRNRVFSTLQVCSGSTPMHHFCLRPARTALTDGKDTDINNLERYLAYGYGENSLDGANELHDDADLVALVLAVHFGGTSLASWPRLDQLLGSLRAIANAEVADLNDSAGPSPLVSNLNRTKLLRDHLAQSFQEFGVEATADSTSNASDTHQGSLNAFVRSMELVTRVIARANSTALTDDQASAPGLLSLLPLRRLLSSDFIRHIRCQCAYMIESGKLQQAQMKRLHWILRSAQIMGGVLRKKMSRLSCAATKFVVNDRAERAVKTGTRAGFSFVEQAHLFSRKLLSAEQLAMQALTMLMPFLGAAKNLEGFVARVVCRLCQSLARHFDTPLHPTNDGVSNAVFDGLSSLCHATNVLLLRCDRLWHDMHCFTRCDRNAGTDNDHGPGPLDVVQKFTPSTFFRILWKDVGESVHTMLIAAENFKSAAQAGQGDFLEEYAKGFDLVCSHLQHMCHKMDSLVWYRRTHQLDSALPFMCGDGVSERNWNFLGSRVMLPASPALSTLRDQLLALCTATRASLADNNTPEIWSNQMTAFLSFRLKRSIAALESTYHRINQPSELVLLAPASSVDTGRELPSYHLFMSLIRSHHTGQCTMSTAENELKRVIDFHLQDVNKEISALQKNLDMIHEQQLCATADEDDSDEDNEASAHESTAVQDNRLKYPVQVPWSLQVRRQRCAMDELMNTRMRMLELTCLSWLGPMFLGKNPAQVAHNEQENLKHIARQLLTEIIRSTNRPLSNAATIQSILWTISGSEIDRQSELYEEQKHSLILRLLFQWHRAQWSSSKISDADAATSDGFAKGSTFASSAPLFERYLPLILPPLLSNKLSADKAIALRDRHSCRAQLNMLARTLTLTNLRARKTDELTLLLTLFGSAIHTIDRAFTGNSEENPDIAALVAQVHKFATHTHGSDPATRSIDKHVRVVLRRWQAMCNSSTAGGLAARVCVDEEDLEERNDGCERIAFLMFGFVAAARQMHVNSHLNAHCSEQSFAQGVAWVCTGLLSLLVAVPFSQSDPSAQYEIRYWSWKRSLLRKLKFGRVATVDSSYSNYCAANNPTGLPLAERNAVLHSEQLKDDIDTTTRRVEQLSAASRYRPPEQVDCATYEQLWQQMRHFATSTAQPQTVLSLCLQLFTDNESRAQTDIENQILAFQRAAHGLQEQLSTSAIMRRFPDVVLPFMVSMLHLRRGMGLLSRCNRRLYVDRDAANAIRRCDLPASWEQWQRLISSAKNQDKNDNVNAVASLLSLPLVNAKVSSDSTICSSNDGARTAIDVELLRLSQIFALLGNDNISAAAKVRIQAFGMQRASLSLHARAGAHRRFPHATRRLLRVVRSAMVTFVRQWEREKVAEAEKIAKEQSNYRTKSTEVVLESDDVVREKEFRKAFPNYHLEFADLLLDDGVKDGNMAAKEQLRKLIGFTHATLANNVEADDTRMQQTALDGEAVSAMFEAHTRLFQPADDLPRLRSKRTRSGRQVDGTATDSQRTCILLRGFALASEIMALEKDSCPPDMTDIDMAALPLQILSIGSSLHALRRRVGLGSQSVETPDQSVTGEDAPSVSLLRAAAKPSSLPDKMGDFYSSSNEAEVCLVDKPLQSLSLRLIELLREWRGNAILQLLLRLCDRIRALPVDTPMARLIVAVELLLFKAEQWEQVAAKHVSIRAELRPLELLVRRWRALELQSWPLLLKSEENRAKKTVHACWPPLLLTLLQCLGNHRAEPAKSASGVVADAKDVVVDRARQLCDSENELISLAKKWRLGDSATWVFEPFLHTADVSVGTENSPETSPEDPVDVLVEQLQSFVTSGTIGEYDERVSMLHKFHSQMLCEVSALRAAISAEKSDDQRQKLTTEVNMAQRVANVLYHVMRLHQNFSRSATKRIKVMRAPLEAELKAHARLCKWDDRNYFTLHESSEKAHRKCHKTMLKYRDILQQPVLEFIRLEKKVTDSVVPLKIGKPVVRGKAEAKDTCESWTLSALGAQTSQTVRDVTVVTNPTKCLSNNVDTIVGTLESLPSRLEQVKKFIGQVSKRAGMVHVLHMTTGTLLNMNATIKRRVEELSTPGVKKDGKTDGKVAAKKRALSDLFKDLRKRRVSALWNKVPDPIRSSSLRRVFESFSPVGHFCPDSLSSNSSGPAADTKALCDLWNQCEEIFFKSLPREQQLRDHLERSQFHTDISHTQVRKMVGFCNHLAFLGTQQRFALRRLSLDLQSHHCCIAALTTLVEHLSIHKKTDTRPPVDAFTEAGYGKKVHEDLMHLFDSAQYVREAMCQTKLVLTSAVSALDGPFAVSRDNHEDADEAGEATVSGEKRRCEQAMRACSDLVAVLQSQIESLNPGVLFAFDATECGTIEDIGLQDDLHVFCASAYEQRLATMRGVLRDVQTNIGKALHAANTQVPGAVLAQVRAINNKLLNQLSKTSIHQSQQAAKRVTAATSDNGGKALRSSMITAFTSAIKTVMLSIQHFHTKSTVDSESDTRTSKADCAEGDNLTFTTAHRSFLKTIHRLQLSESVAHVRQIGRLAATGDRNVAIALAADMLPFLRQQRKLALHFAFEALQFHLSLRKLLNRLGGTFLALVDKGFCKPPPERDDPEDDGKEDQMEEGTGMGEGEGTDDVSNQIEDEEQLLGLQEDEERFGVLVHVWRWVLECWDRSCIVRMSER